jgi:phage shock protein PspC (stress-responsive transcriptional regulator)
MNSTADTTTQNQAGQPPADPQPEDARPAGPRTLCRPSHDRMLAGVAAGVARYLGVDVTIVRIAFVVLTFIGGAAVPVYLAGWLLIPEEGSDRSIASDFFEPPQR